MNKFLCAVVATATAFLMASCEEEENLYYINTRTLESQCTDNGVWSGCFTNQSGFDLDGIHFSHASGMSPEKWWSGFCPSVVRDTKEYTSAQWADHQWATIAGHGAAGDYEAAYIVAHCDQSVTSGIESLRSGCVVSGTDGITFKPYDMYVSNTTMSYYAMLNGTETCPAFEGDDWLKLTVTGYRKGIVTNSVDVMLTNKGVPERTWLRVKLKSLGLIDQMVFTLTSSRTGETDIDVPAYFCIDALHMH